jgi:hypothetical protein
MVEDIYKTTEEGRGADCVHPDPEPLSEGSAMHAATFLTSRRLHRYLGEKYGPLSAEVVDRSSIEEIETPATKNLKRRSQSSQHRKKSTDE